MFAVERVVQEGDAHFVGGLLAPGRGLWRRIRVARVVDRVVVGRGHQDAVAFRERKRLLVEVRRLPVKVPVGDGDERDFGAARQDSRQRHFAAQEVHVGRDGQQVEVYRGRDAEGRDGIVAVAGRDVEAVDDRDDVQGLLDFGFGKVQADAREVGLRLAVFVVMDLQDDPRPGGNFSRDAVGKGVGGYAGRPAAERSRGRKADSAERRIAGFFFVAV